MAHRNYHNNLDFITDAFRACLENANDLIAESRLLLDQTHRARALSLSILGLEELGKLFCVDALLYARVNDEKARLFAKSLKSHTTKLSVLTLLPLLLKNIAAADPRYSTDEYFVRAFVVSIRDLQSRGNTVYSLLDNESFSTLDRWKQSGFYAQPIQNSFVTPRQVVTAELAEAVSMFAWRAASTLDFLLEDGNLERYIDNARQVRSRMTEADHAMLETAAAEFAELLFPTDEVPEDTPSLS